LINRRLALSERLENPSHVMETLRRERELGAFSDVPGFNRLDELVVQSGVSATAGTWLALLAVLSAAFYVLLGLWFGFGLIATLGAAPAAAAALYLFLRRRRRQRIARFTEQLPDALDVIVRGLRAGHPFRVALGLVSREMPDPIGTEFGILADE